MKILEKMKNKSHLSTPTSHRSGITLIALIVTIVILLILAAITINLLLSEGGLFERAQSSEEEHEKAVAREKLELKLADMQAEKLVNNRNYTEGKKDYEYLSTELWEEGYIVNGDIVTVDDWQFIIDRSIPKIIDDSLGKGEKDDSITIECSEVTEKPYTFSTITVKITSAEDIQSIIFNGENILELIDKDENYSVDTEGNYVIKVTENKTYNIYVQNANEKYNYAKIEVNKITEDMEIWNKADLVAFREKVNEGRTFEGRKATVMADIDLNKGKYTVAEDGTVTFISDAEQWIPIANYVADNTLTFKGTFEGNNHTISGIYINNASHLQGLFGDIKGGTVKNTIISNSNIGANHHIGAFAGAMRGTIENCHTQKTVKITGKGANSYGTYVGGLVGCFISSEQNKNSIITKCSNLATVSGVHQYVGGFVGVAEASEGTIDITECYNAGKIIGNNQSTGGIIGLNAGGVVNITDCYNLGTINGNTKVGGISGSSHGDRGKLNIKNAYNKGTITGSSYVGQIIGRWEIVGTQTNTYGSTQTVTAELLGEAFTNDEQNPNGTWKYNNGYPILKWQLKQ